MSHPRSQKYFSAQTKKTTCASTDSQLLLFRALGRILNSKREENLEVKVPSYIPDRFKRKELVHPIPENQCTQR